MISAGTIAPDFTLPRDGDGTVSLSALRPGKVVGAAFNFTDASDVIDLAERHGSHVEIDFGGGDVLRIRHTKLDEITVDDFIL